MGFTPPVHDHHDLNDEFWTTASAADISRDDFAFFLANPTKTFRLRPGPTTHEGGPSVLVLRSRTPTTSYPGFTMRVHACAMPPGPASDAELEAMNVELERLAG